MRRLKLQIALGRALANGGRSTEAADVFYEASEALSGLESLQLRQSAAEQYLRAGQLE